MVYEAKVTTENNFQLYYGTCEGEFKSGFYNHLKSFGNSGYENKTELSKFIWQWRTNPKIKIYVRKYFRMQRPINVVQSVTLEVKVLLIY